MMVGRLWGRGMLKRYIEFMHAGGDILGELLCSSLVSDTSGARYHGRALSTCSLLTSNFCWVFCTRLWKEDFS